MSETRTITRYSKAFQQKVVTEIEIGKLTIAQARKIYDIKGSGTINYWLKKFGKNHLIAKVVRIEMKDEKDKVQELERQKKQLESALAQAHLKIISLESLIESAEARYQIDIKKKLNTIVLQKP
jgi:transposase